MSTGTDAFVQGLRDLGYSPVALEGKPDHVVINYEVPTGHFAGKKVRLGFIVPPDFPMTAPTGLHVSPHIHPINPSQEKGHPLGGVHQSTQFGDEWQYWSRPFIGWPQKTVEVYMSHIWRLWASQ